jgi:hypothetical protein
MGMIRLDSYLRNVGQNDCKNIYRAKAQSDEPRLVIPSKGEGSEKDFSLRSK